MDRVNQRRGSLDSISSVLHPAQPLDPAVLDDIHAVAANSPTLTSFALASPNRRKSIVPEQTGLNRIYNLVRGVVGNGRDSPDAQAKHSRSEQDGRNDDNGSIRSGYSHIEAISDASQLASPTSATNTSKPSDLSPLTPFQELIAPIKGPSRRGTLGDRSSNNIYIQTRTPQPEEVSRILTPRLPVAMSRTNSARSIHSLSQRTPATSTFPRTSTPFQSQTPFDHGNLRDDMAGEADGEDDEDYGSVATSLNDESPVLVDPLSRQTHSRRESMLSVHSGHAYDQLGTQAGNAPIEDDRVSEISTDEDDAIEAGGFLGKVAGLGKALNDKNLEQSLAKNVEPVINPNVATLDGRRTSSASVIQSPARSTFSVPNAPGHRYRASIDQTIEVPMQEVIDGDLLAEPHPRHPSVASPLLASDELSQVGPYGATEADLQDYDNKSGVHTPMMDPDDTIRPRKSRGRPPTQHGLLQRASSSSSVATGTTTTGMGDQGTVEMSRSFGRDGYLRNSQASSKIFQSEAQVGAALRQLRQGKGLSKDFWMKDENCRECFLCQRVFTLLRRKHHCRTCGQIFCSRCTILVDGDKFGHNGEMRVCLNPCLQILENYQDDDSSGTEANNYSFKPTRRAVGNITPKTPKDYRPKSRYDITTPNSKKRNSRIGPRQGVALDYDSSGMASPSRPSSARSMRRPVSSYNILQQAQQPGTPTPRHQHSKPSNRWSTFFGQNDIESDTADDHRAPFQDATMDNLRPSIANDSIIDPELAPYMSDEDADGEDEPMGIFATIAPKFQSPQEDEMMRQIAANINALTTPSTDILGDLKGTPIKRGHRKTASMSSIIPPSAARIRGTPMPLQLPYQGHKRRRSNFSMLGPQTPASQNYLAMLQKPNFKQLMTPGNRSSFGSLLTGPLDGMFTRPMNPRPELNPVSVTHVKRLLRQLLDSAKIKNADAWESALLPMVMKATDEVKPDIGNHESMDLRQFCKIKRIPGGKPSDSHYVSGVVFTKNLALKSMRRSIPNPRIVILGFPLEYHRHELHFMSLEPVIAQEKEYLRNMVNRIVALNPTVVLVQWDVSGLALDYLREHKIAVAMRCKRSALEAVAHCGQADVIESAEETAIRSHRVGKCVKFEVKTYAHKDIATKSHRRTYMYFSGCRNDLGCTIVLRGANAATLDKIKRITEFMIYAVYNLKLETCLIRDTGAILPDTINEGSLERSGTVRHDKATEKPKAAEAPAGIEPATELPSNPNVVADVLSEEPAAMQEEKPEVKEGDEAPNLESKEGNELSEKPQETEKPIPVSQPTLLPVSTEDYPEDLPAPNYYSEYVKEHENKILSVSPFIKFAQPHLLMRARDFERRLEFLKRQIKHLSNDNPEKQDLGDEPFELITPEMLHGNLNNKSKKMNELVRAVHEAEYDKVLFIYETQKKQWENYLAQNEDLFDPLEHQRIVTLYSMVSTDTSIPCRGPEMILFEFYNDYDEDDSESHREKDYFREPDCLLGEYVSDLVGKRDALCDEPCKRKMMDHRRSYVHGEARLGVHVESYNCPVPGDEEEILIWSSCKICPGDPRSKPMRMSDGAYKYSFGKFLEASFWSVGLRSNIPDCPHDLMRDHIRYFGVDNYAVKIEYSPISLMEIIVPRPKVTWKPEMDLKMKNEIYLNMHGKINRYWDSVIQRLKSINVDNVDAEKMEDCKTEIESLLIRAQEERTWLVIKLQEKYTSSRYYEVIPLNRAMRALQERVAEWDSEFTYFSDKFFPSEKDITRMATAQLRKIFLDRSSTNSSNPTDTESTAATDNQSIQSVTTDEGITMSTNLRRPSQQEEGSSSTELESKGQPTESNTESIQNSMSEHSGNQADSGELRGTETETDRTATATEADDASITGTSPEPPSSPEMTRTNSLSASVQTMPSVTDETSAPLSPAPSSPVLERHPGPSKLHVDDDKAAEQSPSSVPRKTEDSPKELPKEPPTSESAPAPLPAPGVPTLSKNLPKRKGPSPIPERERPAVPGYAQPTKAFIANAPTTRAPGLGQNQGKRPTEFLRTKSDKGTRKLQKPRPEPEPKSERRKGEKVKLGDHMRHITSSLTGKGKASQLPSVPRSHPMSSTSTLGGGRKVSNLARHFEELSREFQREREDREKRTLAARKGAFRVTSMKPMVEVFKDVERAAQDVSDDEDLILPAPKGVNSMPVPEANKFAESMDAVEHTLPSPEIQAKAQKKELTKQTDGEEQTKPAEETGGDADAEGETPRPKTADNEAEASDTEMSLVSDSEASSKILSAVAEEVLKVPEVSEEIKTEIEAGLQRNERTSLMRLLTNFWSERSASGWSALEYPLSPSDHVFTDSDVIVREDEPSSLIAFTLGLGDYNQKLIQLRAEAMNSLENSVGTIIHGDTAHHHHQHPSDMDHAVQRSLLRETGTHVRYQFQEGNAKMYCKVFFAEQFDALRKNCGMGDRFAESLSRCIKWDSKGGKTKSVFLKTLDDRIVLKQLSQIETQAFLKFAPSYFHIMSEAMFHELPTAIAKMLGFFTIYIKNPNTGTELRWDLLVMENLFYDRKMTRTFDLKGSMRNRYVPETGEQNEVLLDENMVNYIFENPLFVREHSKKILRASLWNDTLFLEQNQVMDYSLMVGIDDQKNELVIGLIDCVRTYTFDKKIENIIKGSGIVGGGRNKPTVISPKEYKRRFRVAMERYVLEAPNCWRQPRVTWLNPVGIPFATPKQAADAAAAALATKTATATATGSASASVSALPKA